ncbi:MAG TPA: hypothetical protein V6C82_02245 [Chroococcales cyanobacterium]
MKRTNFILCGTMLAASLAVFGCTLNLNPASTKVDKNAPSQSATSKVIKGQAMVSRNAASSAYRVAANEPAELIPAPKGFKVTLDDSEGKTQIETTVYDDQGHYQIVVDTNKFIQKEKDNSIGIVTVRNLQNKALACAPVLIERPVVEEKKDDGSSPPPSPAPSADLKIDDVSTVMAINAKASLADGKDVNEFVKNVEEQRRKFEGDAGSRATGRALMESSFGDQNKLDNLIGAAVSNTSAQSFMDEMKKLVQEHVAEAIAKGAIPPEAASQIDQAFDDFKQQMQNMPTMPMPLPRPSGDWKPPLPGDSGNPGTYPSGWGSGDPMPFPSSWGSGGPMPYPSGIWASGDPIP